MCGFAGFSSFKDNFKDKINTCSNILEKMGECLQHRGPDEDSIYLNSSVGFAHRRLSIIDTSFGKQPMLSNCGNYIIVYNGELYNTKELKNDLETKGYVFRTSSDTEVVLASYIIYGEESPNLLNGIFAYTIFDNNKKSLFLCRDRFGVKPLFYTLKNDYIIFASEIKALFKYPEIDPILDKNGLCEIFGLFPSRTEGNGVFKNINEIKFGHYAVFNASGFVQKKYWNLTNTDNNMTYSQAVEETKFLVTDAIRRQVVSDVPLSTFLSGGIDSSIITAIIAKDFKKDGRVLDTYSFDFEDNAKYFVPNSFQNDVDKKWVIKMVEEFKTNHTFLECDLNSLVSNLYNAVDAKDYPGMADIDSSLLYFCSKVKEKHNVALSGECADEIFGGYPWFHDNPLQNNTFPWLRNADFRSNLLCPNLLKTLNLESYIEDRYQQSILECPKSIGETLDECKRRQLSYINIKWFMPTLLERSDRMSMYSGVELRVPYSDHRIVELLWNTPWDIKCSGVPKSLLRDAFKDLLPPDLLNRKKTPYPKTYNPIYEDILKEELKKVLKDSTSPILPLLNIENVNDFISLKNDYGKPWFGQLMAGPQLIAYYLQVNYWLKKYNVTIEL
jgi:asparagine synthase (glutamine-hydrolysing)